MTTPAQIRAAAKAAVKGVYTKSIYTARKIDARDKGEYLKIYLVSGDIDEPGAQLSIVSARLVIAYYKKSVDSDDDLDRVIEAVHAAFIANFHDEVEAAGSADGVGYEFTGFEYGDEEEAEFSSISYSYDIAFEY